MFLYCWQFLWSIFDWFFKFLCLLFFLNSRWNRGPRASWPSSSWCGVWQLWQAHSWNPLQVCSVSKLWPLLDLRDQRDAYGTWDAAYCHSKNCRRQLVPWLQSIRFWTSPTSPSTTPPPTWSTTSWSPPTLSFWLWTWIWPMGTRRTWS